MTSGPFGYSYATALASLVYAEFSQWGESKKARGQKKGLWLRAGGVSKQKLHIVYVPISDNASNEL